MGVSARCWVQVKDQKEYSSVMLNEDHTSGGQLPATTAQAAGYATQGCALPKCCESDQGFIPGWAVREHNELHVSHHPGLLEQFGVSNVGRQASKPDAASDCCDSKARPRQRRGWPLCSSGQTVVLCTLVAMWEQKQDCCTHLLSKGEPSALNHNSCGQGSRGDVLVNLECPDGMTLSLCHASDCQRSVIKNHGA